MWVMIKDYFDCVFRAHRVGSQLPIRVVPRAVNDNSSPPRTLIRGGLFACSEVICERLGVVPDSMRNEQNMLYVSMKRGGIYYMKSSEIRRTFLDFFASKD